MILSLNMESRAQLNYLEVQDHDSSSNQSSAGLSHNELTVTGGDYSKDQCVSSESGQIEIFRTNREVQVTTNMFPHLSEHLFNESQITFSHPMTCIPYAYTAPNFTGLMTAYGQHLPIQPQIMGIMPGRVPLPPDLTEDGPIYVNAKQYNGILRRRQSRARLEAQNKLLKSRKPYLHESRHIHALNRVRGSGGRFVSAKNKPQANSTTIRDSNGISSSTQPNQRQDISEFDGKGNKSISSCNNDTTSLSSNGAIFRNSESRSFPGIPYHISATTVQDGGGMCSGATQNWAPVVR